METQKLLSISDLEKMGYSKEFLYRVSHMTATPFFRTNKRGKFYVIYENFINFISTRRIGR